MPSVTFIATLSKYLKGCFINAIGTSLSLIGSPVALIGRPSNTIGNPIELLGRLSKTNGVLVAFTICAPLVCIGRPVI